MKKFLSMFAFVAAIVFGAFTLASCGNDDDDNNSNKEYNYKMVVTGYSSKASASDLKHYNDSITNDINLFFQDKAYFRGTDKDAMYFWNNLLTDSGKSMQRAANELADKFNDDDAYVTLKLLRNDNSVYNEKTWNALSKFMRDQYEIFNK